LSNQTTLGKSEEELLDHLGKIVRQVIEYEEQAREILLREATTIVADKVWRAYGTLRHARTLTFEETMNLLSGVRLGAGLNLIPGLRCIYIEQTADLHPARALGGVRGSCDGRPCAPHGARHVCATSAGLPKQDRRER